MIVNVTIEDRADGGVRVYSDDLPGLILSGRERIKVIADIEPAARALLEYKGVDCSKLRIDASFIGVQPEADSDACAQ